MSLKSKILEYISREDYEPALPKSLAKKLGVKKKSRSKLDDALLELVNENKVRIQESGLVIPTQSSKLLHGVLRKVSTGNGYVILHEPKPADLKEDIFIDRRDLGDAQTGDEVAVALTNRRKSGGQRCGRIIEVLNRASNRFVGLYFEEEGQGYVFIDGKNYEEAIWVGDPGSKGAKPDDKVVIEMIRFPTQYAVGEAVLVEVLGERGKPGVDTLSIIHEYNLPTEFSPEALAEASEQTEQFNESDIRDRLDLTQDPIVTIDPASARDFDDAISLIQTDNGHFHLGVHIADVSHFVQPNTALDRDAYSRATSVYLPTKVIPMLPEVLSNGLASLQQDRVRFVKSAFIEFNAEGIPVDVRFANSAIKVRRRFTYEEVMAFLQEPDKYRAQYGDTISDLLLRMQTLARILRHRRFDRGSLELSMPELQLQFDDQGKVCGAAESVNDESHQIIEEFMLAANTAVATELFDRGIPFLRRVHGSPTQEKVRAFQKFIESLGIDCPNPQDRAAVQALLDRTAGTPLQRAVHFSFLRSLQQAEYSPEEAGHYALNFEHYCHFTSPIRRYPDLTVHRIIDKFLIRGEKYKGENTEHLGQVGLHCSDRARRAEKAERDLTKLKLLQYMERQLGQEFDAVITGVERFGLFCQCVQIPAEGLIHLSTLGEVDHFYYDRDARTLVGKRTNLSLRLGMAVRVKVTHVDIDRRDLDMSLVRLLDSPTSKGGPKKKRAPQRKQTTKKPPMKRRRKR